MIQDLDLGLQGLFIGVFEFRNQLSTLALNQGELGFELDDVLGMFGNLRDLLYGHQELSLDVLKLDFYRLDVIIHLLDLGLTFPLNVLQNVPLLVADAQLVVSINQLDTNKIPSFAH